MADQRAERVVVEWGVQLDCEAEGCDPPHADDGRVFRHDTGGPNIFPTVETPPVVNNHAARWVTRSVSYSGWEPAFTDSGIGPMKDGG